MKSNIEKVTTSKLIAELNRRMATKLKEVNLLKSEIENVISNTTSSSKLSTKTQTVKKTRKVKAKTSSATNVSSKENTQSLPAMITEILTNNQDGLTIKAILSELEKTDWQTTSTNKYNLVGVALASNKEKFEKISRGTYRLKPQQNA